jgi:hypothetical protein
MVTTNLPDRPTARLEVRRRDGEPWVSPGPAVLIGRDRVVVHAPARVLLDSGSRFRVHLSGPSGAEEWIGVSHVDVVRPAAGETTAVAAVTLRQPTRSPAWLIRVDRARLARALERHGDVWRALEEAGVLPRGLRERHARQTVAGMVADDGFDVGPQPVTTEREVGGPFSVWCFLCKCCKRKTSRRGAVPLRSHAGRS